MKKNMLLIIAILFVGFFAFAISAKAIDCSAGSCYCNDAGDKCSLLRNPRGIYTKKADMTKCGCKPTGQNPPANSGSGSSTASKSGDSIELCDNPGIVKSIQIVGWCLFVLKIVAPFALLIVGTINLSKAVISSDDNAIKSSISSLVKKAIAAVVIFFVPTIVMMVFSLVENSAEALEKYECLSTCLAQPAQCVIPSDPNAENLFE